MSKTGKFREKIESGTSNANIDFDDLVFLLIKLDFQLRNGKGSHRIFSKSGVTEIINLQALPDGKAKPYQVKQVCDILKRYKL